MEITDPIIQATDSMKECLNLLRFYTKREVESPSNHQDMAQEAQDRMHRFSKALRDLELYNKSLALKQNTSLHKLNTDMDYNRDRIRSLIIENISGIILGGDTSLDNLTDVIFREIKAAETDMFDRFWDIAVTVYGVKNGVYTPGSLIAAIVRKRYS